jgi:hypothetical protein
MAVPCLALVGCGAVAETLYVPALRKRPQLARAMIVADTTKFSNGVRVLKAVAYDAAGRAYNELIQNSR